MRLEDTRRIPYAKEKIAKRRLELMKTDYGREKIKSTYRAYNELLDIAGDLIQKTRIYGKDAIQRPFTLDRDADSDLLIALADSTPDYVISELVKINLIDAIATRIADEIKSCSHKIWPIADISKRNTGWFNQEDQSHN